VPLTQDQWLGLEMAEDAPDWIHEITILILVTRFLKEPHQPDTGDIIMADLTVKYMGLALNNPLIVASSSLSSTPENVCRIEDAGAGAVVLKSLFEEEIRTPVENILELESTQWYPEMMDVLKSDTSAHSIDNYVDLIRQAKSRTSFPVIASINCQTNSEWIDYAAKIKDAGADALELNIAFIPNDPDRRGEDIENLYVSITSSVRRAVRMPIAVKISSNFTSMTHLAHSLSTSGASSIVLFNRYYSIDIDLDAQEIIPCNRFSHPEDYRIPLRWISLLSSQIPADLSASTGIHETSTALKMILAGASTVQLCSVLYINGLNHVGVMLDGMKQWMETNEYSRILDFKGRLSQLRNKDPDQYERLQYIKSRVGFE
jgi:dihydroorotate dehydrogenase (fumarate)